MSELRDPLRLDSQRGIFFNPWPSGSQLTDVNVQSPGHTVQLKSVTTGYVLVLRRRMSNTFITGGFTVQIYAAPARTDLNFPDPTIWEKMHWRTPGEPCWLFWIKCWVELRACTQNVLPPLGLEETSLHSVTLIGALMPGSAHISVSVQRLLMSVHSSCHLNHQLRWDWQRLAEVQDSSNEELKSCPKLLSSALLFTTPSLLICCILLLVCGTVTASLFCDSLPNI